MEKNPFEDFYNRQRTMDIESKVSVLLLFMLFVLVIFQGRNRFVRFLPAQTDIKVRDDNVKLMF